MHVGDPSHECRNNKTIGDVGEKGSRIFTSDIIELVQRTNIRFCLCLHNAYDIMVFR